MFAVPGWSVSSSALKQQTELTAHSSDASHLRKADGLKSRKPKKRKRDTENVTEANVDEIYRRIIENHQAPKPQFGNKITDDAPTKKRKKNRNQKEEGILSAAGVRGQGTKTTTSQESGEPVLGTSDPKKKKKNKRKQQKTQPNEDGEPDEHSSSTGHSQNDNKADVKAVLPAPAPTPSVICTPLQQAMRQKLISSRFRHLNETLYTTPSSKALELFTANPELFQEYHAGLSRQVREHWPSNPVDGYIQSVRARASIAPTPKLSKSITSHTGKARPLPRRPSGLCTIADLGCGDAQLARALIPSSKKLSLNLLSYDLHAPDPLVTKADISNLPLEDGSVDIAIFCLSLMGTNWVSFVEEAWRILRSDGKGECWISEVKSRFGKVTRKKAQIGAKKPLSNADKKKLKKQRKKGKLDDEDAASDVDDAEIYAEDAPPTSESDETDISALVEVFRTRGFLLRPESVDKTNKMFVKMEFVKQGGPPTKGKYASAAGRGMGLGKPRFIEKAVVDEGMSFEEETRVLKPCVYKVR